MTRRSIRTVTALRLTAEDRASTQNARNDLGQALLDGHPAGVSGDQVAVGRVVVGDDDGALVAGPGR